MTRSRIGFWASPPSDLPNRHRGCAASHQKKVRRHSVELDPHRDALCQADVGLTKANSSLLVLRF
jgi:hypothetical protein